MKDKFFLGVADDNYTATAVVGDSEGKVIATSETGSVNFHFYGLAEARRNLRELIEATIGWGHREKLEMASFTYKSGFIANNGKMCNLIRGVLGETEMQVTEFTTTCTLGVPVLNEDQKKMVLIGGQTGVVVYDDFSGLRFRLGHNFLTADLFGRVFQILQNQPKAFGLGELLHILQQSLQKEKHKRLAFAALAFNQLAEKGNPLALEILGGIAHDLIRLVMKMVRHIEVPNLVVGLYGPILLGCTCVYERVNSIISDLYPQAELQAAPLAPAKGAYLSCLQAKRLEINNGTISNLLGSLRNLRRQNGGNRIS